METPNLIKGIGIFFGVFFLTVLLSGALFSIVFGTIGSLIIIVGNMNDPIKECFQIGAQFGFVVGGVLGLFFGCMATGDYLN